MGKIAIYGKGGTGKSTTIPNVSAAIITMGLAVIQIGCDPRTDSTYNLTDGKNIPTMLSILRERGDAILENIVVKNPSGVPYVESGGPVPDVGCAGRDIITTFEKPGGLDTYKIYRPDVVLYDVLGDVVCSGFVMPIRGGYADEVYIITFDEVIPLYAASNIVHAVKSFGKRGYTTLRGLVFNTKNVEGENKLVNKMAEEIEAPVLYRLSRHPPVQQAEAQGETMVEAFPDSDVAAHYRELAQLLTQKTAEGEYSCPMWIV